MKLTITNDSGSVKSYGGSTADFLRRDRAATVDLLDILFPYDWTVVRFLDYGVIPGAFAGAGFASKAPFGMHTLRPDGLLQSPQSGRQATSEIMPR